MSDDTKYEGESLEDFLNYSSYNRVGYLAKWKDDGSVIVWLHRAIAPRRLWRHPLRKVVEVKDKATQDKKLAIWSDRYVCLEPEDILKDQNRLNRLTQTRVKPPHTCPVCLFQEYVRKQIISGKLHWLAPVLKWETDDEEVVVRAQGMLGYPKPDKLSDKQKEEMREHGVNGRDSWQENLQAKLNWIFAVVEHKHPEKGVQVAVEAGLLGDKVRRVIKQTMEASMLGGQNESQGNPLVKPYPIKFSFNSAQGIPFGDKYDATAIPTVSPTEEISALISSDPPREAIDALTRAPDLVALRENLEKHCVLKNVPWDEIFAPAYAYYKDNGLEVSRADEKTEAPALPVAVPTSEVVACDKCSADMLLSETVCKACGFDYDPKPVAPPPAAAPRRSRSAAVSVAPAPTPKVTVEIDDQFARSDADESDGSGDKIPF